MLDDDDWRRQVYTPSWYDELAVVVSTPEQYLMLAILMRAVFDLMGYGRVDATDRRSAQKFFNSKKHQDWIFSFHSIACHLSSDPEDFKRRVLRYLEQGDGKKPLRVVEPQ